MYRTAVASLSDYTELPGPDFAHFATVNELDDLPRLTQWLKSALEHLMDSVEEAAGERDVNTAVRDALQYMRRHCSGKLSRDDVASAVGMSPSHFSTEFRNHTRTTFTSELRRIRTERAAYMLRRTDL